jgi:hypothetical protein
MGTSFGWTDEEPVCSQSFRFQKSVTHYRLSILSHNFTRCRPQSFTTHSHLLITTALLFSTFSYTPACHKKPSTPNLFPPAPIEIRLQPPNSDQIRGRACPIRRRGHRGHPRGPTSSAGTPRGRPGTGLPAAPSGPTAPIPRPLWPIRPGRRPHGLRGHRPILRQDPRTGRRPQRHGFLLRLVGRERRPSRRWGAGQPAAASAGGRRRWQWGLRRRCWRLGRLGPRHLCLVQVGQQPFSRPVVCCC